MKIKFILLITCILLTACLPQIQLPTSAVDSVNQTPSGPEQSVSPTEAVPAD